MNQQYSMQALTAANLANVEAMRALGFTSIKAAERLLNLNMEWARTSLSVGADYAQPALSAAAWQETMSRRGADLRKSSEDAAAYFRGVRDISTEAQAEMGEVVSARVNAVGEAMTSLLDTMARSVPAGSEKALAAVKSAVANTCSAYGQIVKAAQHAAEASQVPKQAKKAA
ncbi:MAG: phasin family protein [Rhodocyclaceae bacterium]|nr:phasin family protein [Rhodocyclaceae bacterium]